GRPRRGGGVAAAAQAFARARRARGAPEARRSRELVIMTAAHLIYIPMVLIVGLALGFFLGGRAARDAVALEQKKIERRAAARAARQQAASASKTQDPPST